MACSDQINSTDLENAKTDAATLAEVATSRENGLSGGALIDSSTTRLGDTFSTLRGQLAKLGYEVPIAYASSIVFTVDDGAKTVEEGGIVYAPKIGSLPFTTSGTFVGDDDARFRVVSQDLLSGQVATNTANIATNTANIATNTANIATNTDAIAELSQKSVAGSAIFANSTNNISLVGIGAIDGLEVGDVLQVSGSTNNDTEFTVEVITDDDNVIVNQAHAGGSTSKSLTNETASVTVTLLSKWYDAPMGLGQGWVNFSEVERPTNITQTNNTGRLIKIKMVSESVLSGGFISILEGSIVLDEASVSSTVESQISVSGEITSGLTYTPTYTRSLKYIAEYR